MTQEEKAKRYDEVFNAAKEWYNNPNSSNIGKSYLYAVFPELKESEDEKIRKELIGFLRNIPNHNYTCEEMALWLEKQGAKHLEAQPRYSIGDVICDKLCTTLNKDAQPNMEVVDIRNGMYICDKGSFPVSQQDEYVLVGKKIDSKLNDDSVSNELRTASFAHAKKELKNPTCPDNEELELVYTFEEGAKWQAAQKPTWSEEDIATISRVISIVKWAAYSDHSHPILNDEGATELVERLKSLKERYTWKPSDEQLFDLKVIAKQNEHNMLGKSLMSLYNDLLKLKE